MIKRERVDLAILLLVCFLLSTYLFFRTYVISLDGAFQYIPMAKDFALGLFREGFQKTGQQPLYPLLISIVFSWVKDFELAGMMVSSFFGLLIILPVYSLGKRIFGQQVAFSAVLLFIIHPYIRRFSADVLKESTYLFFLAAAIWFAWRAIQEEKKYPFFFVPLFSMMAYLVRPDGGETLILVFFYILFIKKFNVSKEKWVILLLLFLSSVLLFLPYLIYLKETTGTWTLSRSKTISEILGLGRMSHDVSLIHKVLFSFKALNTEIFAIYHPLYLFFLILGLLKRRFSHFRPGENFLFLFCVLHYAVLFLLVINTTEWSEKETVLTFHFSARHALPLLLFSIYWVGEGMVVLYDWIYKKIESKQFLHSLESNRKSVVVWGIFFVLILAVVLPKTLKPQRYERLTEKKAGLWIKTQSGKDATIVTTLPRVAYYAEGVCESIDFDRDKTDKIKSFMTEKGALYVTIHEREHDRFPEVRESLKKVFTEVSRFEGKGMETIIVYKRVQ